MKIFLVALSVLFISACGQTNNIDKGTDLLEGQRELMEKAEDLEDDLQDALDERMKDIEN